MANLPHTTLDDVQQLPPLNLAESDGKSRKLVRESLNSLPPTLYARGAETAAQKWKGREPQLFAACLPIMRIRVRVASLFHSLDRIPPGSRARAQSQHLNHGESDAAWFRMTGRVYRRRWTSRTTP